MYPLCWYVGTTERMFWCRFFFFFSVLAGLVAFWPFAWFASGGPACGADVSFPKCSFRLGVLKLVSASVTLRWEVLLVLPGLRYFDVLSLRFYQRQQPLISSLL